MSKVKFTKGELKKQRDLLIQFRRYLPTLQLKKQQLQIEILHQTAIVEEKRRQEHSRINTIEPWAGLLSEQSININPWVGVKQCILSFKNIAGVNLPVFERLEFEAAEYDLFSTPLWVDTAVEQFRNLIALKAEISLIEEGIRLLRHELRITTQRVNLFEKVKIPESEEAIRLIKIYIGDQMANAVGRSKMAKRKIEQAVLEGLPV